MPRELVRYLWDIVEAGEEIATFTQGISFQEYEQNAPIRYAVERCFGILGEAMNQARNLYPGLKLEIQEHKEIVNFRNRIVHGYLGIDEENVWSYPAFTCPTWSER